MIFIPNYHKFLVIQFYTSKIILIIFVRISKKAVDAVQKNSFKIKWRSLNG